MIVCHCNVVSDRDIRAAIDAGANEPCALASICGAASECGGCLPAIRRMLDENGHVVDTRVTVRTIRDRLAAATTAATAVAAS